MTDLVPQAVRDLLAFYAEHCPEERFGDLDITVLKRTVESIDGAAKDLIAAEHAVEIAREQFRGFEAELSSKAGRTLAFLKIFVEGSESQLAELEAIGAAMPAARRKSKTSADEGLAKGEPRKRRGRKGKKHAEAADESESGTERTIEAALEKVSMSDAEPTDLDAPLAEPGPAMSGKKKHGSKFTAAE